MANQTLQLQQLLHQEGFKVDIVQVNSPYTPAWVANLRGIRAVFRLAGYLVRLWHAAGQAQLFHVMANSGLSWHLFAAPAVWIGYLRRVPVIVNYRGGEAEKFFKTSFRRVRPTLIKAAAVIVPSGYLQKIFSKWGIESRVVPNIINTSVFSSHNSSRTGASRENPRILVARNLEPIYDIASAIQAFHRIRAAKPGAVMTIAGSGPESGALRAQARRLGLQGCVEFTGRLDNAAMAGLYARADVLLNTSLADNMPISLLEAMACAIPIVSTDVGGIPYLVENEKTALLVKPGDFNAMAESVIRLLEDDELYSRLAANALTEAQKFIWTNVREDLFRVYRSVSGVC